MNKFFVSEDCDGHIGAVTNTSHSFSQHSQKINSMVRYMIPEKCSEK